MVQAPRDIISINIMLLDDEKEVLKKVLQKLYKDKKLSLLTVRSLNPKY